MQCTAHQHHVATLLLRQSLEKNNCGNQQAQQFPVQQPNYGSVLFGSAQPVQVCNVCLHDASIVTSLPTDASACSVSCYARLCSTPGVVWLDALFRDSFMCCDALCAGTDGGSSLHAFASIALAMENKPPVHSVTTIQPSQPSTTTPDLRQAQFAQAQLMQPQLLHQPQQPLMQGLPPVLQTQPAPAGIGAQEVGSLPCIRLRCYSHNRFPADRRNARKHLFASEPTQARGPTAHHQLCAEDMYAQQ